MNTKQIIVCLTLLAVLIGSAQSLTFNGHHLQRPDGSGNRFSQQPKELMAKKSLHLFLNSNLFNFLVNDEEIKAAMDNQEPLSDEAISRIREFFNQDRDCKNLLNGWELMGEKCREEYTDEQLRQTALQYILNRNVYTYLRQVPSGGRQMNDVARKIVPVRKFLDKDSYKCQADRLDLDGQY